MSRRIDQLFTYTYVRVICWSRKFTTFEMTTNIESNTRVIVDILNGDTVAVQKIREHPCMGNIYGRPEHGTNDKHY